MGRAIRNELRVLEGVMDTGGAISFRRGFLGARHRGSPPPVTSFSFKNSSKRDMPFSSPLVGAGRGWVGRRRPRNMCCPSRSDSTSMDGVKATSVGGGARDSRTMACDTKGGMTKVVRVVRLVTRNSSMLIDPPNIFKKYRGGASFAEKTESPGMPNTAKHISLSWSKTCCWS